MLKSYRGLLSGNKVFNKREMAVLCRQMYTLFRAGVPLLDIIKVIFLESGQGCYKTVGQGLYRAVSEGESLKSAFAGQGKIFPPFFTGMVALGEETGTLEDILRNLSVYYHRDYQWREKLRTALLYPAVVALVAGCIAVMMVFFVLPNFAGVYSDMDISLPALTSAILETSNALRSNPLLLFVGLVVPVASIIVFFLSPRGRRLRDDNLHRLPLVGALWKKILLGRFCRTMALLLENGIPLWEGLDLSAELLPNPLLQREVAAARDGIWQGQAIAVPLQKGVLFPPYVRQLLRVGEQSGNLAEMLNRVADLCEYETEQALSRTVALVEPALIIGLAGGVGTLIISLVLPMFDSFTMIR